MTRRSARAAWFLISFWGTHVLRRQGTVTSKSRKVGPLPDIAKNVSDSCKPSRSVKNTCKHAIDYSVILCVQSWVLDVLNQDTSLHIYIYMLVSRSWIMAVRVILELGFEERGEGQRTWCTSYLQVPDQIRAPAAAAQLWHATAVATASLDWSPATTIQALRTRAVHSSR